MKKYFIVLTVFILFFGCNSGKQAKDDNKSSLESGTKVGNKAPAFCLQNQDNKKICLNSFKNKWVVLYFYPKDDTPGCTKEACDFSDKINDFKGVNAVVIGVSTDTVSSHKKFAEKHKLSFNLLSDKNSKVAKLYNVDKTINHKNKKLNIAKRQTFLINPEGIIVYVWKDVNVMGHVDDVKKTLEEKKK